MEDKYVKWILIVIVILVAMNYFHLFGTNLFSIASSSGGAGVGGGGGG